MDIKEYTKVGMEHQAILERDILNPPKNDELEDAFDKEWNNSVKKKDEGLKHKYIRRTGSPGDYTYYYRDGSTSKKPNKQESNKPETVSSSKVFDNYISIATGKQKEMWIKQKEKTKDVKVEQLSGDELKDVVKSYSGDLPKMKECFSNAQRLATRNKNIGYIEGFYIFPNIPIPLPHAWNKINGKYFDPTQQLNGKKPKGVLYRGKEFTTNQVFENMEKTKQFTSLLNVEIKEELKAK